MGALIRAVSGDPRTSPLVTVLCDDLALIRPGASDFAASRQAQLLRWLDGPSGQAHRGLSDGVLSGTTDRSR